MKCESEHILSRRDLLRAGAVVSVAGLGATLSSGQSESGENREPPAAAVAEKADKAAKSVPEGAVLVSTWNFGLRANAQGLRVLQAGGTSLDAAEAGVRVVEADPKVSSVGLGGYPNSAGVVQLDASVMNGADLRCGGVAALQNIVHPVSVARKVMELTPHVLLVGEGAKIFALSQGFVEQNLLTGNAVEWLNQYQKRLREREEAGKQREEGAGSGDAQRTAGGEEDHDTIGMIVRDRQGRLGAAVTTSGLGNKLPGRVGDSPLVGCGLYADDEAGACVSTGVGEEAIRVLGSFLTVENMRRGASPLEAVMETLKRVRKVTPRTDEFQLAFLAVGRDGTVAGGALHKGFKYAFTDEGGRHELIQGEVL